MFATNRSASRRAFSVAIAVIAITTSSCTESASPRPSAIAWNQLAAAYPSLAGSDGLIVPTMEPETTSAGTLYQTAYGRAALRSAGRVQPPASAEAVLKTIDSSSTTDPIWSAFQICIALGKGAPSTSAVLNRAERKMGVNLKTLAVNSVKEGSNDAGYGAQVLSCMDYTEGNSVLNNDVRRLVGDSNNSSYQRYLAATSLVPSNTIQIESNSLPELPNKVACSDPTRASDWMAIHELHRMADSSFYRPEALIRCAVGLAGRLNVQSALAATIVADRKPDQLQQLSTPVIDPIEQQTNRDGILIPPPAGGLRWTFSYMSAVRDGGADIPTSLSKSVQNQIDNLSEPNNGSRSALLAGMCSVDRNLKCPSGLHEQGSQWIKGIDFSNLEVNVYTWVESLHLARELGIKPKSKPSEIESQAFVKNYSDELEEIPGLANLLISAASKADMPELVHAIRPLSDPRKDFNKELNGGSLSAAGNAYTAARILEIDTTGWLVNLTEKLSRYALNDVTGFPYSDSPQPAAAESIASISAATLLSGES